MNGTTSLVVEVRMELRTEGSVGSLFENRLDSSADPFIPLYGVGLLSFSTSQRQEVQFYRE